MSPGTPIDVSIACGPGTASLFFNTMDPKPHVVMLFLVRDRTMDSIVQFTKRMRCVPEVVGAACIMSTFMSGSTGSSVATVLAAAASQPCVLDAEVVKVEEDDDDIHTSSTRLTVKDQVSWAVLGLPARGLHCLHVQCFDLTSFLQLHARPSFKRWECPVCNKVGTPPVLSCHDVFAWFPWFAGARKWCLPNHCRCLDFSPACAGDACP